MGQNLNFEDTTSITTPLQCPGGVLLITKSLGFSFLSTKLGIIMVFIAATYLTFFYGLNGVLSFFDTPFTFQIYPSCTITTCFMSVDVALGLGEWTVGGADLNYHTIRCVTKELVSQHPKYT